MAKIKLATEVDDRGAKRLNKELGKTDAELKEITKRATGATAAARKFTDMADPTRRLNREFAKLATHVKAGRVNMDDATAAAAKLQGRLDRVGGSAKGAFSKDLMKNVAQFAGGLFSVSAAAQAVRSELDLLKREADKIAKTQIGAAGARETLRKNLAGLPQAQFDAAMGRADSLASKLGQPQPIIDTALSDAYSGGGGNLNAAVANVRVAAKYNANTPDAIAATAGGLADVSSATGSIDPYLNLGVINKTGAASRVVDADKQLKTIPKAMAGMVTAEATFQESAAMFAAFSNALKDQEGNRSVTAVTNFGAKLEKFANSQIKAGKFGAGVDTFSERLAAVRGNPMLAAAFMAMAGGEETTRAEYENLLMNPNSPVSQLYKSTRTGFGSAGDLAAHGKRILGRVTSGRSSVAASTDRTIKSGGEKFKLMPLNPELSQEATDEFYDTMVASDPSVRLLRFGVAKGVLPRTSARVGLAARVGPTLDRQEAIEQYERRISQLEEIIAQNQTYTAGSAMGGAVHMQGKNAEFAHETGQQIQELRQINANLVQLHTQAEENKRAALNQPARGE